jgi:hypothetical protein
MDVVLGDATRCVGLTGSASSTGPTGSALTQTRSIGSAGPPPPANAQKTPSATASHQTSPLARVSATAVDTSQLDEFFAY